VKVGGALRHFTCQVRRNAQNGGYKLDRPEDLRLFWQRHEANRRAGAVWETALWSRPKAKGAMKSADLYPHPVWRSLKGFGMLKICLPVSSGRIRQSRKFGR
jgi:hypothetical protein